MSEHIGQLGLLDVDCVLNRVAMTLADKFHASSTPKLWAGTSTSGACSLRRIASRRPR